MDAVGAQRAFVLPAIPEVGRTTVGGEQRIDGVPVHRTAFADDPQNPVRDVAGRVGDRARDASGRSWRFRWPRCAALADQSPRSTRADAPIVVLDAETDADLAAAVQALLRQPRPLVVVGSTGVARALRAALAPRRRVGGVPWTGPCAVRERWW